MQKVQSALKALANPAKAIILQRFFKTGKGEYGEGDIFLGIQVPQLRLVAKQFAGISLKEIEQLLNSKIHEERMVALFILVIQFQKAEKTKDAKLREIIFHFYLTNARLINNWDLVDLSAPNIVGNYLLNKNHDVLFKMARSENLWEKRIAIISTFSFIRAGQFEDTFKIVEMLLNDKHDLIHKACGWMLREVGKRNQAALEEFLELHYSQMPRTMLRYA
ncbi:MAG: DNA alkylation repair protein, partial [Candidatus Micrarchaeota archaeon]